MYNPQNEKCEFRKTKCEERKTKRAWNVSPLRREKESRMMVWERKKMGMEEIKDENGENLGRNRRQAPSL